MWRQGNENGKVVGKKWWLSQEAVHHINKVPLNERIETAVLEVLRSKVRVRMDEVLQKIFIKFPNSMTPDQVSIQTVLREYAQKSGGQWRLRPEIRQRESQHSMMIFLLAEIGKKLGFNVWVGTREQHDAVLDNRSNRHVTLKTLVSEGGLLLRGINPMALSRLKDMDVVWHAEGRVHSVFEVENTTGITEALIRGSNVPYPCSKFIVLPAERETLMKRKLREPAFRDRFDVDQWNTIYYTRLALFWQENMRRSKLKLDQFLKIAGEAVPVDPKRVPTLF